MRHHGLLAPQRIRSRRRPRPPSPADPTCGGEPTPPWPGLEKTDECGCSPTSTTGRRKPGLMSSRPVTGSPPCNRSTTLWSTGSGTSVPTWLEESSSETTGDPNTGPSTSSGRSPGPASPTTPPTSENPKPTAVPNGSSAPSRSMPVGRTARHRRRPPPSRPSLDRALQQPMAHPTPRTPNATRSISLSPHRGGSMKQITTNHAVQRTGCCSLARYHQPAATTQLAERSRFLGHRAMTAECLPSASPPDQGLDAT